MAFNLDIFPVVYCARYDKKAQIWNEQWITQDTVPFSDLQKMSSDERKKIYLERGNLKLPAVSYTSQYGYGCFEGMKAFPHKDGSISLFRPDKNAARFAGSMQGLKTAVFPPETFLAACSEFIKKNAAFGYVPAYKSEWEKDSFSSAESIYLRPFMNSEAAIGVGISQEPYVLIVATIVSTYFKGGNTKACTTRRIRATPFGTGNIKCASNYVISAIAKRDAEDAGFMEVMYLDAEHHTYLQEGSSCNVFFLLKNGTLVTPELGDTILPGITRASVIELAKKDGVPVKERLIAIEEVMADAVECFVTGTAAGATPIESITHNGKEAVFNGRKTGELTERLQRELKGIQYGVQDDVFGWNVKVL